MFFVFFIITNYIVVLSFRHTVDQCLAAVLISCFFYNAGMSQRGASVSTQFLEPAEFSEDWRWVHFTSESGLPSNVIYQIYETSDSTIGVATPSGLASFDGFQWNLLGHQHFSLRGEFRDGILGLSGDSLFLLSHQNGIRFLLKNVRTGFPLSSDSIIILRNGKLETLLFDAFGTFQIHEVKSPNNVNNLFQTRLGTLWLETEKTVYRLSDETWVPVLTSVHGDFTLGGGMGRAFTVVENQDGSGLLYITRPHQMQGIWEWEKNALPKRAASEKTEVLKAMDISPEGDAIAVYRPDVVRYRSNGIWRTINLEQFGINDIISVRFRSNGDLLIGTGHGLYRYSSAPSRWESVQHPPPDLRNSVNELLIAKDFSLWIATGYGIEHRLPDGTYSYINQIDSVHLYALTGLAEDNAGNIWISSGSGFPGAFLWNGKEWRHVDIGEHPKQVAIHKIRKDRQGNLWFLGIGIQPRMFSKDQPGAFLLQNGTFIPWGEKQGLLHGRVYSFAESYDGSLWFGTINGLCRWRPTFNPAKGNESISHENPHRVPEEGTWTYWTKENGFLGDRVFSLATDRANRVWFSEFGSGLSLGYVDEHDSLHYIPPASGIECEYIFDMFCDISGVMWFATNTGLYNYWNNIFLRYDSKSGLSHNELFALFPTSDKIYVGTQGKGYAMFEPVVSLPLHPKIIFDETVIEEQNVHIRWKAYAHWGEIPPSEIFTRYSLNSEEWSGWEKRNSVSLNKLPPGKYTIQVQAKGLFGQYNLNGVQTSFSVLPPYYYRPLFVIPVTVLALSVLSLGVALHLRRRKHVKELIASESKFRGVTQLTASAIIIFDDDLRIIFVNEGAAKLTGYQQLELLKMKFTDVLHPDIVPSFRHEEEHRKGDSVRPHRREIKIRTKKGEEHWLDLTYGWVRFQEQMVTMATAFDITERRQAEESLRTSEERYRLVSELMSDYAYLDRVEPDGKFIPLWLTESFYKLTGYTPEESMRYDFIERFVHPEDVPIIVDGIQKSLHGQTARYEVRIFKKDGTMRWLSNEVSPMWDNKNERVTHMYGAARDITERKQDEERLRALTKELSETEERERRRMANFLHDIIGQALILCKLKTRSLHHKITTESLQEELAGITSILDQSINHTQTLTFDLYPTVLYQQNLEVAISWLAERMQQQHDIRFLIEDDHMAKPLADEMRHILFQAVREIFVNIIKHAEAKNVTIKLFSDGTSFYIGIFDDGVGFDTDKMPASTNGGGFGLFNIRQRLENIGGKLDISSTPGKGTRVTIIAPLKGKQ
ncbi:MAG: PAS domain S-box protein [Ignavibacteriae bacterium]|nr:PAS domain S-box protein [Ignavibacteriota bacterium]